MLIIPLIICAVALGGFVTLTIQVVQLDVLLFDERIIGYLRSLESGVLTSLMRIVTTSASGWIIALLSALICGALFWKLQRRVKAGLLAGAMALSGFLTFFIKLSVGRPRPEIYPWLASAVGLSYPSGHTLPAVVLAGAVSLFSRRICSRKQWAAISIILIVWALSVGVSRVYLGVHYPSDIIASICLGVMILSGIYAVDRLIGAKKPTLAQVRDTVGSS